MFIDYRKLIILFYFCLSYKKVVNWFTYDRLRRKVGEISFIIRRRV